MNRNTPAAFYPVQPFFVTNAERYLKHLSGDSGIAHYYSYTTDKGAPPATTVIPDGSVDVIFKIGASGASASVCGYVTGVRAMLLEPDVEYFGVRYMPGCLPSALGLRMCDLADNVLDFVEVTGDRRTLEQIASERDFLERARIFETKYSGPARSDDSTGSYLVPALLANILENEGQVHIRDMENYTGFSERYIRNVFKDALGISPKAFCNFIRFQAAVKMLNRAGCGSIADIAIGCGYFDQSHLLKEFHRYAGESPVRYLSAIDPPNYWKKIVLT
ncbi:MAG: helix-turn-helix domain-containing protein [Oscillospiraceae bacterium]|jgi:AraC-like DNA-binding protein|nr:helix-turn-helix domain-containing protein [Oscillospiraceae bacterium]